MKKVFIYMFSLFYDVYPNLYTTLTCGVDRSNSSRVYEGKAGMETYPWMGTLFYPLGSKVITTAVVLVTKQIVLAGANDIDMLPKNDMRERSRVVLGRSCNKSPRIKIRNYSFHPDFRRDSYSALAIVQLNVDISFQELRPICGPPNYFINPQFYSMTSSDDCNKGQIQIRKMRYVAVERCKKFYNRTGLNEKMFWPSNATCARALSGGKCVWRSGTALVVKQDGRWRLLGFSTFGPGCQFPARFIDYGMHVEWVKKSVARIGQPAITRLGVNHVILRRPLASVQRYGPCDPEETKHEIFTESSRFEVDGRITYNVTLVQGVEYSCVIFKVERAGLYPKKARSKYRKPKLYLRRWCAGPQNICHGFQFIEINFFVEIESVKRSEFHLAAFGKELKIMSAYKSLQYANSFREHPKIKNHVSVWQRLKNEEWGSGEKESLMHFYLYYYKKDKRNPREDEIFMKMYRLFYRNWVIGRNDTYS